MSAEWGLDGVISTVQTIPANNLTFGPDGSLHVSATIVNQILPTAVVVPVAGNAFVYPYCPPWIFGIPPLCPPPMLPPLGDGGPATQATIFPAGIAVDSASNLYIADTQGRIREVVNSTGVINTIAGAGSNGYSGDGGLATDSQLSAPMSVVLDTAGNLYIADTGNFRVLKGFHGWHHHDHRRKRVIWPLGRWRIRARRPVLGAG